MSLSACYVFVFFFSSRRRHTRLQGDWSSDVCSSDLYRFKFVLRAQVPYFLGRSLTISNLPQIRETRVGDPHPLSFAHYLRRDRINRRSEERRVGKEGRSRWSPYH